MPPPLGCRSPVLARAAGLQLAPQVERAPAFFDDAADELADEGKLGLGQGQRIFGFHHEQRRKFLADQLTGQFLGWDGHILLCELGKLRLDARRLAGQAQYPVPELGYRFLGGQYRQQTEPRREVRIFLRRVTQQILHPGTQLVVPGRGQRKYGPLRPLALARSLLGRDEASLHQKLDHGIERAIANFDALVLVTLLQGGGHFEGCIGRSNSSASTASASGLEEWASLAIGENSYYTGTYIRIRI